MTHPFLEVEYSKVRRNTFGDASDEAEPRPSGPKKMTVGCVIFTVPLRKRVSQAVVHEMNRESSEIVSMIGSGIPSCSLIRRVRRLTRIVYFASDGVVQHCG